MTNLAVPDEPTLNVGQILTAADLNTNLRDAINFVANPPLFVAYQATAQSIAANTTLALIWDTIVVDTYGGGSAGSYKYTAQVAGYYRVSARVAFSLSTGYAYVYIATNSFGTVVAECTTAAGSFPSTETVVYLDVGDTVAAWARQSSSSAKDTYLTNRATGVEIAWVHA